MSLLAAFHIEAILVGLALFTLLLSSVRAVDPQRLGRALAAGVLLLFFYSLVTQQAASAVEGSVYRIDDLALVFRQLCLVATALVLLLASEYSARSRYPAAEQFALMLLAATGMLVLCTARDFVLLFVALELLTTASYVLVAFPRTEPGRVEASVKYLAMGALSTAFIAYGTSFVFGTTGSTGYDAVREALSKTPELGLSQGLGVTFVLAALAFKVAAVPAHMWAPDVYQGASLPVTAFLATGSKCAAFAALLRLLFDAFLPLQPHWAPLLLIVAGATAVWGSFGALRQTDLRRLMGYSSVTHTGYLLFAAVSGAALSVTAILFYLVQYVFSTLACFFVIAQLTRNGGGYSIAGLSGLNRRAPWLSWMMAASLLSLTGIPPLSGFLAKYLVLVAVPNYEAFAPLYFIVLGLVLIAIVVSVVYYFGILRTMWSDAPSQEAASQEASFNSDRTLGGALLACVALILMLGVYPEPLLGWVERASQSFELKPSAAAARVAGNAELPVDAAPSAEAVPANAAAAR